MLAEFLKGSKAWNEIYKKLVELNNQNSKLAGTLFERFCKLFFLSEPTVFSDYKKVWLFEETPEKIKRRLGLAKIDYGVDLVLEDREGKFSVVQCKFRNNQSSKLSWSKDKIANLFAEGDKADFFIVFTNASGLDKHSKHKKEEQFKLFSLGNLLEIEASTFGTMLMLVKGKKPKPVTKAKPRDYQKIAIEGCVRGFESQNRGQLILPCGAGKTLTALWLQEALRSRHTLVLVPSLALLRQIKNEWHKHQKKWLPYLCVCSEKDIDRGQADSTLVHTYEIGGNVTTDSKEIGKFLTSHRETIIYSTYQSLDAISKAISGLNFSFDLALCDEAHKTAGSKKSSFGLIHNQKKIPVDHRLYMTATPRILSAQAKSALDEEKLKYVADMSDVEVFGPEFHRMGFKDAIEKKILVDYKIIAVGISDAELREAISNREFVDEDSTIEEMANNFALNKTMKKYKANHAITFHSSIKKANTFREKHLGLYPDVFTSHVSGKLSTNDRKKILDQFDTSGEAVVTNARCLTEGVDVPGIDMVYFCDPKNSKIDIVQAAGRALRRADHRGKKFGYIVVPIFHEEEDQLEKTLENSAFKNLVNVIRAMCDQDERLQAEITRIKIGQGKRRPSSNSRHVKIIDEVPLVVLENFEQKLKKNLFSSMIDKVPIPWRSFEDARSYVHALDLKNQGEWRKYAKGEMPSKGSRPVDIPSGPAHIYKDKGWIGYGDWLGTSSVATFLRKYRSFEKAVKFVHSLKLKSSTEWQKYCGGELLNKGSKPTDIPANPWKVYKKKGWTDWGDWLGTGVIATNKRKYKSFKEARRFVHKLGLKSQTEWYRYNLGEVPGKGRLPENIPAVPNRSYRKEGWVSWGDWLGTGRVADQLKRFRSFEEARRFVHKLSLKSQTEWHAYKAGKMYGKGELPEDIPAAPDHTYRDKGWVSWGDWLGTGRVADRLKQFRSFKKAREYVHKLGLKNQNEWREYAKSGRLPEDIPAAPRNLYRNNGWVSLGDWLGTGRVADQLKQFRSFDAAREYVHTLGLKNNREWREYIKSGKLPKDIPAGPERVYKKTGWIGWRDWLRE